MKHGRAVWTALLLLLGGGWQTAPAADTFRWTDEQGKVHYSDRVPPEQAKSRRARLNEQGFEVEVVQAPKTREQVEREQLLKQLRMQQEKVLEEQREQDQALMRTYRSTDEILAALKVKLDSLDGIVRLTQTSLERDQRSLSTLQGRMRDLEQREQPIPQPMLDSQAVIHRRMTNYAHQIQRTENEKLATADRFKQDLKRFLAIQTMQARNEDLAADWTRSITKAIGNGDGELIISAVECTDKAQCDRYWGLARDYLRRKTGHSLPVDTEKILQTAYPRNDSDFGVTITLLQGRANAVIFMDVLCRPTNVGEQLCRSARVRDLQTDFQRALLESAPNVPTTPSREPPDPP